MSAHGFRLGTSVGAVINGHWRTLEIVGVALAPEFTYSLAPGAVFPDDRRFGVFWLRRSALASSVAMRGAFNDVVLRVARDASVDSVIQRVDALLERYGGRGAIPRADQQSHIFVENEFAQIRAQSIMLPGLFLFVAATLLQVVTRRRCVQCPVVTGPAPACGLGRLASMARFSAPDKSGAAAKVATASGVFAPVIL